MGQGRTPNLIYKSDGKQPNGVDEESEMIYVHDLCTWTFWWRTTTGGLSREATRPVWKLLGLFRKEPVAKSGLNWNIFK